VSASFVGTHRQGPRLRLLGAELESLALFLARRDAAAREVAREPSLQAVRGPPLEGRGQDGDEAASGVPLRSGTSRLRHARHPRHDAGRNQAEQGQDHLAAPVGSFPLLEGQHSVESSGTSDPHRKHDSSLRQDEGRLVDQHGPLQSGAYPARRHRRQDRLQEEPRQADQVSTS